MSPLNENGPFPLKAADDANDDVCQHCGTSLIGDPIPEENRRFYGGGEAADYDGPTHYRREIGNETADYDGILFWTCPDCLKAWPRWTGEGRLASAAAAAVAAINDAVDHHMGSAIEALRTNARAAYDLLLLHGFRPLGWVYFPYGKSLLLTVAPAGAAETYIEPVAAEGALTDLLGTTVNLRQVWPDHDDWLRRTIAEQIIGGSHPWPSTGPSTGPSTDISADQKAS